MTMGNGGDGQKSGSGYANGGAPSDHANGTGQPSPSTPHPASHRQNGNGNGAEYTIISHESIGEAAARPTVSSSTSYCNYNEKAESRTPGLPAKTGTGYPIR